MVDFLKCPPLNYYMHEKSFKKRSEQLSKSQSALETMFLRFMACSIKTGKKLTEEGFMINYIVSILIEARKKL